MSFILDALRKSEKERQQGVVPGISDVPAVVHASHIPRWVIAVIAVLCTGILILSWAWWNSRDTAPAELTASRPTGVLPQARPGFPTDSEAAVRNLAREPIADTTAAPQSAPSATPAPVPVTAYTTPTSADMYNAPTMAEVVARGVAVPPLTLELHVFSSQAEQRFVRINSASYREGERLNEGPTVEAITEEGVVLRYLNENFLLLSD
jgi:general secretion pathway protein B